MVECLCTAEVVEVQGLDAALRFLVALGTYRTENLPLVVDEQLVEDVDAEITRGSCQQHIANVLPLSVTERIEVVGLQEGIERRIVLRLGRAGERAILTGFTRRTRMTSRTG